MSYQVKVRHPLIQSIITSDLYKSTMCSVFFHYFPYVWATCKFINRNKTPFPPGFAEELTNQIEMISELSMTNSEFTWFNTIRYMRPTYLEWFKGYRYNPKEVTVLQNGGELDITIAGPLYRITHWEVILMALISELYFVMMGVKLAQDWEDRVVRKGKLLEENGCFFSDFGTRRRFSAKVQDRVVEILKQYKGFTGTSNPHLAHKHGVIPIGTFAHEYIQTFSGVFGPNLANRKATEYWAEHYAGDLGIALTDTFTTDVFLRDFDMYQAKLYDGVRHDSNDPYVWGEKMLAHYAKLGIPASNKRLVFSDNLKVGPPDQKMIGSSFNYIALHHYFQGRAQPNAGIGTSFSNDCISKTDLDNGITPLNMVIKLSTIQLRRGSNPIPVVKLSDVPTKNNGTTEAVAQVKRELGIE